MQIDEIVESHNQPAVSNEAQITDENPDIDKMSFGPKENEV